MFSFRGDKPNLKHSSKEDFIFQAIEWIGLDFKDEDDDEEEDENPYNQKDGNYLIKIYGCTKDCQSVCVKVENFKPYFFVKVWDNFNNSDLSKFRSTIKDKVFKKYQDSLENVEIIKRKEFYGFTNEKLYKFIKLSFKSIGGMKGYVRIFYEPLKISYNSKPYQYRLYESNIDPLLRFNHEQETKPVSWIKLPKGKFKSIHKDLKETICNFEFKINHSDVQPFECPDIGPMLVASFDIECVSMDGGFPEAKKEGDKVIQIGTTVHRHGETDCCLRHIIVLGPCHEIEGAIVESYETEEEVLLAWRNFMKRLDPDILTGYNIWGFDLKYMYDRAKLLEIDTEFCQIGRLRDKVEILEEKTLQSSALGQNFFYILQMEGRIQIDLMKVVQRDFKLEMYKLDFVAETFLGEHKVDLPPKELFKKFIAGGAQNNQDIAVYCVQDCELVNRLINKLQILTNNVGMGNVCLVPLSWLFLRGQGVKIYSLVACQCRKEGFLIKLVKKGETVSGEDDEGGYEGAIVLVAEPGVYMEPISVMDYASLYPSSMLSENISHDSVVYYKIYDNYGNIVNGYDKKGWYPLVEFKEADEKDKLDEYLDKLGYKSNYITYDNFEGEGDKKYKSGVTKCCYAERKEPDEIYKSTKSVVPRILDNLLWERRSTRASAFYQRVILKDGTTIDGEVEIKDGQHWVGKYKQEKIPYPSSEVVSCKDIYSKFQQDVLDGLQLAYKVTANSLYGQVGAPTSPIYFKELAASTTATGRDLLRKAQYYTESKFKGAKCVYGDTDSVFVSFTKYMEDVLGWDLSKKTPKEILEKSIELGIEAGKWVTSHLKKPHDLEYEKTFYPFIQLAKKRYVGNKYEINPDKFKQTSMGIVLKRRDNANICKRVYGGIIDIILNKKDIQGALVFFKEAVKNLLDGKDIDDPTQPLDLKDLVITKTLRGTYKGTFDTSIKLENYEKEKVFHIIEKLLRQRYGDDGLKDYRDELKKLTYDKKSIEEFLKKAKINDYSTDISWEFVNCSQCHTALSRRMGERDPGNKPQSNDRIPFVYVQVKEKKGVKTLQGDKVEHPQYIRDNPDKCKPDWYYYLEHQVKVPCIQLFALVLEQIPGYKPGMVDMSVIDKWRDKGKSEKELKKKLLTLRESATEKLLLGEMINKEINRQKGNTMLTDFFKVATRDEVFENMKTSLLSLKKKEPTLAEVKTKVNLKVKEKPTEELDFASKKRVIKIKVEKKKAKEKEKVEKKRKPREKLTEEEKVAKRKNARKEKLEHIL